MCTSPIPGPCCFRTYQNVEHNHKDRNNDLSNLQTLCLKCHGRKDGLRTTNRKLTPTQVLNIRHIGNSVSSSDLAKAYGVTFANIRYILKGATWKELL